MNNLDKIIEKIDAEAQNTAAGIIAAAEKEAAKITEEGKERAANVLRNTDRSCQRESLMTAERAVGASEMKKREITLATKVGLINKAFAEAQSRLLGLPADKYCVFLTHLLSDAVRERIKTVEKLRAEYGEDEEEYDLSFAAKFNDNDRRSYGAKIVRNAKSLLKKEEIDADITLSKETASIEGGVIVVYGDMETNCSVEAVINGVRDSAEGRVRDILFN